MITYPFTTEGLDEAIEQLGDSPNAFADTLSDLGFRGKPGVETCCPIANYIRAVVAGVAEVEVGCGQIVIRDGRPGADAHTTLTLDYEADDPVEAFIVQFDHRRYPDLIEEESA